MECDSSLISRAPGSCPMVRPCGKSRVFGRNPREQLRGPQDTWSTVAKIQSDSQAPTIFPGQFPRNSHLFTAVGMLTAESDDVHLENKASRFR
jgi:hypothetical protein